MAADGRTLITAPAMLQDVWTSELAAASEAGLITAPLDEIYFVSYSGLCRRVVSERGRKEKVEPYPRDEFRPTGGWDTVICDESHYLKERNTNWTQAVGRLKTEQLFLLTGTPLPNWGHEIYTALRLLDPANPEFSSYWRWARKWFKVWQPPYKRGGWEIGALKPPHTWDSAATAWGLDSRWRRRLRDEVLTDLPPLTEQTIEVPMTSAQQKVYDRLKKDGYADIEGQEVVAWSSGGVWVKMLKVSTGLEAENPDVKVGASGKLDVLEELLRDRTRPTLVFTAFRSSTEAAARRAAKAGHAVGVISGDYPVAKRRAVASDFQRGKYDVLVGTLGTMAEGLTLTAADTAVFLERDPRPSKMEQARRRIHRLGQTHPCLSIDLVSPGVDKALAKLVREKDDQGMAALRGFDLAALL